MKYRIQIKNNCGPYRIQYRIFFIWFKIKMHFISYEQAKAEIIKLKSSSNKERWETVDIF